MNNRKSREIKKNQSTGIPLRTLVIDDMTEWLKKKEPKQVITIIRPGRHGRWFY